MPQRAIPSWKKKNGKTVLLNEKSLATEHKPHLELYMGLEKVCGAQTTLLYALERTTLEHSQL